MASERPKAPSTSFPFRLQLPKAIRELDLATRDVLEGSWNPGDMGRASEIADALAEACRVEGLRDESAMARSIGSLMRIAPEHIHPIEAPFREKIDELLSFLKSSAKDLLTGTG